MTFKIFQVWAVALAAGGLAAGCSDDGDRDGNGGPGGPKYVVSSAVFGTDNTTTTYVSILDSLEPQTIDYDQAAEFPGWADIWVHDGHVFVSDGESPTITKFAVEDDGRLAEKGTLSFAAYGIMDSAFWGNTFVSATKAYMINGVAEYVIWNPVTMEITGTLPLPTLEEREGFLVRAGTTDRSNVIRDGRLYQPMYWSDEDYARFTNDSRIVVIDVETDTVEAVLEAPCAGLDVGTIDEAGNIYFSTWTSGVYAPLTLDAPANCIAEIPAGEATASAVFSFADVTEGREGAAVRHVGDDRLVFSVFHDERVDLESAVDPWALIADKNWRVWSYDPQSGAAAAVEGIDWNSGAVYTFEVDGTLHALIPGADYASTTVYELGVGLDAVPRFETQGWAIRLFRVR